MFTYLGLLSPGRALVCAGLALLAASSIASAQGNLETGFGSPFISWTGSGADFAQSSATTRTAGVVTPTQISPFVLAPVQVPAGAQVVERLLCWNYLLNGNAPAQDTILVNGQLVTGTLVGVGQNSLGWGKAGAACYLARSVAALVPGAPLTIQNACDKALGSDAQALGEGLTVLVVYAHPFVYPANLPARTVHIWVGFMSNITAPFGLASLDLPQANHTSGPNAHFLLNALDGELGQFDELWVRMAGPSPHHPVGGVVAGTFQAGDAFAGLAGPRPFDNLYDVLDGRETLLELNFYDRIDIESMRPAGGDSIAHSLAAYSFEEPYSNPGTYCTPKQSSQHCIPSISALDTLGTTSAQPLSGANDFNVVVDTINPHSVGMILFSRNAASTPFRGGTLCLGAPIFRTALSSTGGSVGRACTGSLSLRINAPGSLINQSPGTRLNFQAWFRDAGDPFGVGLSDAMTVIFQ